MVLVDTNVFLEILLMQNKKDNCKQFLEGNIGNLHITDFSLHSIGVILFRYNKEDVFLRFLEDIQPHVNLLTLPIELHEELVNTKKTFDLDFDDAYQYYVAKHYSLRIATMDRDFEKVEDVIEILFL